MVDIPGQFATAVKRDLNLLYTEPPHLVASGTDFGWFCREHALHSYILGAILRLKPKIILGDISFRVGDEQWTSISDDADHAWCQFGETGPVDLSVEFQHYPGFPSAGLIQGVGFAGSYHVACLPSDSPAEASFELMTLYERCIVYVEREVAMPSPLDLSRDPFTFLLSPAPGFPRFTEIHCVDIFDQITMHCLKLIREEAKPLSLFCDAHGAIDRIKKWNPNAREELHALLRPIQV